MTTDRDFDRRIGSWFDLVAQPTPPDELLARSLERVRATRQRPGWLVRDRGPSPRTTGRPAGAARGDLRWVAAAVALVMVAAGTGLVLKLGTVSVGPSISPSASEVPTSAPPATPGPLPTATARPVALIAFVRFLDNPPAGTFGGPHRLWVVGSDGTGAHDLFPTDRANDKVDPEWSPDGRQLMVSKLGTGKLYLTDASGSEPVLVDTGCPDCADSDASFSTDGTRIAFVRTRKESTQGGQAEIWHTVIATMDLASGRVVELESTADTGDGGPQWSPDGTQIVFSRGWFTYGKVAKSAVFVVDADGQHLRQLTPASVSADRPDWSPDGSRIVFESLDMKIVNQRMRTSDDIYTIRPDGSGLRRLTTNGLSNGATWTPDGRILFSRIIGGVGGRAAAGLWVMDADGANVTRLVPGTAIADDNYYESGAGRDATWQPVP